MFCPLFFVIVLAAKHLVCGLIVDNTVIVSRGQRVSSYTSSIPAVSLIKCESTCFLRKRNGMCNICGYDKISKTCFISNDNEADIILTSDNTKVVLKPIEHICENAEYLVNGVNPVSDAQLSASSVYDPGHAEAGARLNTSPSLTTVGAWCAGYNDANQYIQVQFNEPSHVTGVAIQGRPINTDPAFPHVGCCLQYVTSYKVLYSSDCVNFIMVKDSNGFDMVFAGNTDQDTIVTSMLPSQVTTLCARINPISYLGHISLRFDILGCPIYT